MTITPACLLGGEHCRLGIVNLTNKKKTNRSERLAVRARYYFSLIRTAASNYAFRSERLDLSQR